MDSTTINNVRSHYTSLIFASISESFNGIGSTFADLSSSSVDRPHFASFRNYKNERPLNTKTFCSIFNISMSISTPESSESSMTINQMKYKTFFNFSNGSLTTFRFEHILGMDRRYIMIHNKLS